MRRTPRGFAAALFAALALMLSACTGGTADPGSGTSASGTSAAGDFGDLGGCTPVVAAVSSEKVNLFTALSEAFEQSELAPEPCARIVPVDVASGEAARLLKAGWPEDQTDKPRPVIWSPASTSWVAEVAASEGETLVPEPQSFATTPVVMAMPEQMARTLGWPDQPIGLGTLRELCLDPQGWGKFGGGANLWGDFKLGKTNPNTSTTGLNVLLMQNYAAAGKQAGLTEADIAAGTDFSRDLESCVIHYGDTTGNVLNRMYERDQDGKPLGYVSAVAVEETSVVNYNLGNPTSRVVAPGEQLTPPKGRLVAVYPAEGSLSSDNPVVVLGQTADVTWVTPEQRQAAEAFKQFVQTPEAQAILDDFGFRPVDPNAPVGGLITPENGVDPAKPAIRLEMPPPAVTLAAKAQWEEVRKASSVMELIDVSGSMSELAVGNTTRMEAAKTSAINTLDHFRPTDELGVWAFTTGLGPQGQDIVAEIRPVEPLAGARENLKNDLAALQPINGTPLYDAISVAHKHMTERAEPGRINAIIVLSDGEDTDSRISLDQLKLQLQGPSEGNDPAQVRVFPIIYSQDAPPDALEEIAEASGGQVFNASDPRRIDLVFRQVVNNF